MPNSRRHHFLPQFYLRGFCRNNNFWIFDRHKSEYRMQSPINTAIETDYYSFRNNDGSLDPSLESFLSKIEGSASPIIKKIERQEILNDNDKEKLATFIGILMFRIPEYKKRQKEIRQGIINAIGDDVIPVTEEDLINAKNLIPIQEGHPRISAFDLIQELQKLESNPDLAHNDYIKTIIPNSEMISNVFSHMNWTIILTPSNSGFITTDSPIQTIPPANYGSNKLKGYGIATEGATNIFPLSRNACLALFDSGNGFGYLVFNRKQVRDFNIWLSSTCDRFIIGPNESQIRHLVKRTKVDRYNKAFRIKID